MRVRVRNNYLRLDNEPEYDPGQVVDMTDREVAMYRKISAIDILPQETPPQTSVEPLTPQEGTTTPPAEENSPQEPIEANPSE